MIRFGIVLSVVLIAIGLLAAGAVAGSLLLVMVSIGVAVFAALMLLLVVVIWRAEIFDSAQTATMRSNPARSNTEPAMAAVGGAAPNGALAHDTPERGRRAKPTRRRDGGEHAPSEADDSERQDREDMSAKPAAHATSARVPASHAATAGDRSARPGRPVAPERAHAPDPVSVRLEGDRKPVSAGRPAEAESKDAGAPSAFVRQPDAVPSNPERTGSGRGSGERGDPDRASADRASADRGSADRGRADRPRVDQPGADRDRAGVAGAERTAGQKQVPKPARAGAAEAKPGGERSSADRAERAARTGAVAVEAAAAKSAAPSANALRSDLTGSAKPPTEPASVGPTRTPPSDPSRPAPSPAAGTSASERQSSAAKSPSGGSVSPSGGSAASAPSGPAKPTWSTKAAPETKPFRRPAGGAPDQPPSSSGAEPSASGSTRQDDPGPGNTPVGPGGMPRVGVSKLGEPSTASKEQTRPRDVAEAVGKSAEDRATVGQVKPNADAGQPDAGEPSESKADSAAGQEATPDRSASVMVRVVPGITRYHREDCILIRFLAAEDLEVMSLQAATEGGYAACKACKADQTLAGART